MPPRHGKSTLISYYFPAWYLFRNPTHNIILISYEATFAQHWSRKVRDIFIEFGPFLKLQVNPEVSAVNHWELKRYEGGIWATGVLGPLIGRGANLMIIDDPIKNFEDIHTLQRRDKMWEWFQSTAFTRLETDGKFIILMTRWHYDDLGGRLLRQMADQVEEVRIPAIAEENDPLNRKVDEPLWKEKFNIETLKQIQQAIGTYWFEAMYQGRPTPKGGGIFKEEWIRYYEFLPSQFDQIIISWDMSFKETKSGSYVVGQVWGKLKSQYYLIDQVRGRWDFVDTLKYVIELANKYPNYTKIMIEEKANGPAIIQTLKRNVERVVPFSPFSSKEERAHLVSPLWEAGNVYIPSPEREPWVKDFVLELLSFPYAPNDDQVDAMTQALISMSGKNRNKIDLVDIAKTSFWW